MKDVPRRNSKVKGKTQRAKTINKIPEGGRGFREEKKSGGGILVSKAGLPTRKKGGLKRESLNMEF